MKIVIYLLFIGLAQLQVQAQSQSHTHTLTHTQNQSVHRHQIWDQLLKQYVSETGQVNYSGIKEDGSRLGQYLEQLKENPVQESWSRSQKLAYWINAYNAFTVKLIIDNYPVKSIRDLNRPWGRKFIQLGDQTYSLDNIEHDIIRPVFEEPRIHFALVCAAVSCPKLLNHAYLPEKLDEQLDQQTRYFLNESGKNKLSPKLVELSKLFSWYGRDFTKQGTVIDFINQYSEQTISDIARVRYLDYNWDLND